MYRTEHEPSDPKPRRGYSLLFPQMRSNDNSPPPPGEPIVNVWSVGVTTAPRRVPTLERCLESLARAGWDSPRLFAEPGSEIPERFGHLPLTLRDRLLGAYPNWYLGLAELFMREPRAEAYLMVQDDTVFARGVREFISRELWPDPNTGAVSLYCPSHFAVECPAGFHAENRGWLNWGALAIVFPNPSVRRCWPLRSPSAIGTTARATACETSTAWWARCRAENRSYYVVSPSLAQHIGEASNNLSAGNGDGTPLLGDIRRRGSRCTRGPETRQVKKEVHVGHYISPAPSAKELAAFRELLGRAKKAAGCFNRVRRAAPTPAPGQGTADDSLVRLLAAD